MKTPGHLVCERICCNVIDEAAWNAMSTEERFDFEAAAKAARAPLVELLRRFEWTGGRMVGQQDGDAVWSKSCPECGRAKPKDDPATLHNRGHHPDCALAAATKETSK